MKANTSVVNVLFNQQICFAPNYAIFSQDKQKRRFVVVS